MRVKGESRCPHATFMVLADIVTDVLLVLCVRPGQASGFGYRCQAVSLQEFSVCAMPWLEHGLKPSRCSICTEAKA